MDQPSPRPTKRTSVLHLTASRTCVWGAAHPHTAYCWRWQVLAALDSKDKIPYVTEIDGLFYNLWQDDKNKRGLWRRTTLESFKTAAPDWETVLDIDALNEAEGETWVWKGKVLLDLGPDHPHDLALLKLSRGGADAVVIREFNLKTKSFVLEADGGFVVPEAKSSVSWKSRDCLLVGTNTGEGSMTDSGYPRDVREWKRGTPLSDAAKIYSGEATDVSVGAYRYYDNGFTYHLLNRSITFYTSEQFVWRNGAYVKIPVQDDADVSTFADQFLVELRSDWEVAGKTYAAGSLLGIKADDLLAEKFETLTALFTPSARVSLASHRPTKTYLMINTMNNVLSKISFWKYEEGAWIKEDRVWELPNMAELSAWAINSDTSDAIWLTSTGFCQPTTLYYGDATAVAPPLDDKVKQLPGQFNADGLVVEQHEAKSLDGTAVPYFLIRRNDAPLDGTMPTVLYGYGGFEVSMTPYYMATFGIGWIERGGALAYSNIRGGGEFGPTWHQAALKEKRHKAYEDFIACADNLFERKVTSPKHLGIMGGSNGGLLMGNMLTMAPEKWGAIVCQVPLLDMKRYSKLLAGASWMGEYGDPDVPEEWAYLQRYSAYQNVAKGVKYPPILFTTSTRDDRVHPGHARKTAKKLLDLGAESTLYYENIEGGHGGAADSSQRAFVKTLEYEFLWQSLRAAE